MKALASLLCFVFTLSLVQGREPSPDIFSIDGQKYSSPGYNIETVNSKWDFQSSSFPPISLKEAYAKAKVVIHDLRQKEQWNLAFTQMMTFKDRAIISLVFQRDEHLNEEQKQDGVKEAIICISVLMDGTVLTPKPIK